MSSLDEQVARVLGADVANATSPITISVGAAELEALRERAQVDYGSRRWVGKVVRDAVRHHLQLPRQTTIAERVADAWSLPAKPLCESPRWFGVTPPIGYVAPWQCGRPSNAAPQSWFTMAEWCSCRMGRP